MNPEDLKQILNHIIEAVKPVEKSDNSKMGELFFKFIGTASFALVAFLFNSSNQMQKDMVEIKSNQEHIGEKVNKIETFTDAPRYTKQNADSDLIPIRNQINALTIELGQRDAWMQKREAFEARTNLDIQLLKTKK